jgi:poly(3-hydroxyalkanoate) synthetase
MHLAWASLKRQQSKGFATGSANLNVDWPSLMAKWSQSALAGHLLAETPVQNGPDDALIHGIAAYRRHPYTRDLVDPPPIWQEGLTCLRDYGGTAEFGCPPVLVVPSLINRATILDLAPDQSLVRALAARGLRVFMLDWGWPDAQARTLDLNALITGRLSRAIGHLAADFGPVTLVGYCMGGLLALAAALHEPDKVAALGLLATPWDFHIGRKPGEFGVEKLLAALEPLMQTHGTLPVDALQMLFNLEDPHAVGDKYREFGTTDQTSERARNFVAFEDWLNDGIPLAAPIARETFGGWYGENLPARLQWCVGDAAVNPANLRVPSLVALAVRDRIVRLESGLPLARALPGCTLLQPEAGHVGMIAGRSAEAMLWSPLAAWARNIRGFANPVARSKVRRRRGDTVKEKPE